MRCHPLCQAVGLAGGVEAYRQLRQRRVAGAHQLFDHDVPCETQWGRWFASYTAFQTHYAALAEAEGCGLFLTGCEMTMTEHREAEWRALIAAVRQQYHGPVSYNCDKYGEDHVNWWDAVDCIASSGYYPLKDWENQLDRIEAVSKNTKSPSSSARQAA